MNGKNQIETILELGEKITEAANSLAKSMKPFFDELGNMLLPFYEALAEMIRRQLLYTRLRGDGYSLEFSFWVSENLPETILASMYFRGNHERRNRAEYKKTGLTADNGDYCSLCGRIYDSAVTGEYPCDECGMPLKSDKPDETLGLY